MEVLLGKTHITTGGLRSRERETGAAVMQCCRAAVKEQGRGES
jgi:hypothetical protein